MADPVEVIVKSDPSPTQTRGDWLVKVGAGRGGKNISRHRQKSEAVKRGRREGRKRKDRDGGAVLKVQDADGTIRTEARYGDVDHGGLFGLLG